MATRERVAWIFHEKGQGLHAEVNNGKAGPPDLGCLLAGASFIRGGVMPEIGWFSSIREEDAGRRGRCPNAVVPLTWPYACSRSRPPSASGRKRPARALQGPFVDENLPISGKSPLLFFHEGSKGAACAGERAQASRTTPRRRKRAVDRAARQSWAGRSTRRGRTCGRGFIQGRSLLRKRHG